MAFETNWATVSRRVIHASFTLTCIMAEVSSNSCCEANFGLLQFPLFLSHRICIPIPTPMKTTWLTAVIAACAVICLLTTEMRPITTTTPASSPISNMTIITTMPTTITTSLMTTKTSTMIASITATTVFTSTVMMSTTV